MKLDQRKILRWGPALIGTWMFLAVVASDADPQEGLPLGQEERESALVVEKVAPVTAPVVEREKVTAEE